MSKLFAEIYVPSFDSSISIFASIWVRVHAEAHACVQEYEEWRINGIDIDEAIAHGKINFCPLFGWTNWLIYFRIQICEIFTLFNRNEWVFIRTMNQSFNNENRLTNLQRVQHQTEQRAMVGRMAPS